MNKMITLWKVLELTKLSKLQIHNIKDFPKPVQTASGSMIPVKTLYLEEDIINWMKNNENV